MTIFESWFGEQDFKKSGRSLEQYDWGQLINYAWDKSYGRVGLLMALNDL